jgi:hypothetical protein
VGESGDARTCKLHVVCLHRAAVGIVEHCIVALVNELEKQLARHLSAHNPPAASHATTWHTTHSVERAREIEGESGRERERERERERGRES